MSWLTPLLLGSTPRVVLTVAVGLVVVAGAGLATGVLGVPEITGVQNQFGPVTTENTTVETDLALRNPNPVGVQLGGTTINYTVDMNDVRMARGQKDGLGIRQGNSTLNFTTRMDNSQVPPWWYSHIENGERTDVRIQARAESSLLGGYSASFGQSRQIETDLIGQFDSEEDRPVDADQPVVSDPVLWVNETSAAWDRENLTPERTPMDLSFRVYNPKPYPYAVSELGYTITMNGVVVGEGRTDDVATLPPGTTTTIDTRTVIDNENLDEWWVSHLQRGQTTDLEIQFYAVVDPVEGDGLLGGDPVGEFRVPLEPLDYQRTIETDIFGTKRAAGTTDGGSDGRDGQTTPADDDGTSTSTATPTDTATPTATPTDGRLLDGDSTPTGGDTSTPTATDAGGEVTPTAPGTTTTDDGGLLG